MSGDGGTLAARVDVGEGLRGQLRGAQRDLTADLDMVRDKGIATILAEVTPTPVALPLFTAKPAMDLTGTWATAFPPMVREVTVDRPFVFVITDTTTGAPLFLAASACR